MKKILLAILVLTIVVFAGNKVVLAISLPAEDTLALCTDGVNNDGDLFADLQDPDCAAFNVPLPIIVPIVVPTTENTLALCTDGINNDVDLFTDLQDPDCAAFIPAPVATTTPAGVENTLALCTDGINNDVDLFTDLQDPDCAAFIPAPVATTAPATTTPPVEPENTLALCTDGINNDVDLFTDLQDPDCAAFIPAPVATTTATTTPATTTPPVVFSNSGSSGPTGFGGTVSNFTSGPGLGTPISAVATSSINDGIDMSCSRLFKTFMKYGKKNDIVEVTRLQAFLNRNLGTKISPTGFFNLDTFSAVKLFQLKYTDSVLKPWVDAGLSTDLTTNPSGYVYLTTQRQINLLECPIAEIPMPILK